MWFKGFPVTFFPGLQLHVQSRGTWTRRLYSHFNNLGLRSRTQREKDRNVKRFEKLCLQLSTTDEEAVRSDTRMTFDLKSNMKMRVSLFRERLLHE